MEFAVRPAVAADYPRLMQIAAQGDFSTCDADYLSFIADAGQLLCATTGHRVFGYGGAISIDDTAMVTDLFVATDAREHGVGGAVLAELLVNRTRRITFSAQHPAALAAYRRFGLTPRGRMLYLSGPALGGGSPLQPGEWMHGRRELVAHFVARGATVTANAVVMVGADEVEVLRLDAQDAIHECTAILRAFGAGTKVAMYVPEQHALAQWLLARDFVVNDHDVLCTTDGVDLPPTLAVLHAGLAQGWGATDVVPSGVVGSLGGKRNDVVVVAAPTIAVLVAVQLVFFGMPLGVWTRGLVLGLLAAMLAVGMALIYRANRVVNFAQGDMGSVPVGFAAALLLFWHWPYLVTLGVGLVIALLLGLVVEMAIVRRFRNSPRMVMMVATLGISQLLLVLGILVPRWWGKNLGSERIPSPIDWKLTLSTSWPPWRPDSSKFILGGNDIIAMIVAPLALLFIGWFLNRSRLGTAIRASAERSDRAAMLGIPVSRLNTVVWMLAAVLAFVALFLRSGITGVPIGFAEGLPTILIALAALVIGRMENLTVIAIAATVLRLLEFGVQSNSDTPFAAYPIMAAAMFAALLAQRGSFSRRDIDATSSWRGAEEVRPLPARLARHHWVKTVRYALLAVGAAGVVLLPSILRVDYVIKATAVIAFAIIGMSLVVLTGWAGQVSFGQMAIVGIGAAVSATFTSRWNVDLTLGLLIGGCAGAVAAFAVGVPALRLRGLYLAVTTFALALATQAWLLNDRFFGWFPPAEQRFARPPLFGRFGIDTPARYYAYSAVVGLLIFFGLRGIRRSRTGRVIIAVRENERAAQGFSVNIVRAKLTAFVISGFVAGVGGALYAHLNQAFSVTSYDAGEGFSVFITAVIGGLGSVGGALLGALYLRGTRWFINDQVWQLLSTGAGVLLVLLILPGGLGSLWVKLRDVTVRLLTGTRVDEAHAVKLDAVDDEAA